MMLIKKKSTPTFPLFFDDFYTRDLSYWGTPNSTTNTTVPAVNILENNTDFLVQMAAPGMSKKDFIIELDNEMLTISSKKEESQEQKKTYQFTQQEFNYQSFQRTFQLSKKVVDLSKIKAQYKDGLLEVLIPKLEETKTLPPRQITIN